MNIDTFKYDTAWDIRNNRGACGSESLDDQYDDSVSLYEYMSGKLDKSPENVEKFQRMFDRGFLIDKGDTEQVNIVVSSLSKAEFDKLLPEMPEDLISIVEKYQAEMNDEVFQNHYPAHIKEAGLTMYYSNVPWMGRIYIVDELVKRGVLKPLTDEQKKSVNILMFCEALTGEI